MLSLIIFNVKVSTQRGVNSLHEAANKFFYIVFFFQKRATCEKKEIQNVLRGPILSVLLRFACSI